MPPDRLATIRARWADFPRLRFLGDRPRKLREARRLLREED